MFKAISKEQAESVAYIASKAAQIQRRTSVLIQRLSELYGYEYMRSETGVVFQPSQGEILGKIECVFGSGILSYSLHIVGEALEGRVLVEKSIRDAKGASVWLPVWVIRITENGHIIPSDDDCLPIDTQDHFGSVSEGVRLLGLSILYAIAVAPSRKEEA